MTPRQYGIGREAVKSAMLADVRNRQITGFQVRKGYSRDSRRPTLARFRMTLAGLGRGPTQEEPASHAAMTTCSVESPTSRHSHRCPSCGERHASGLIACDHALTRGQDGRADATRADRLGSVWHRDNTQARKARAQRLGRALTPFDRSPSPLRQAERKRLDRDRPMLVVAPHQLWSSSAARPCFCRQRPGAGRPHRGRRQNAGRVSQAQRRDVSAQFAVIAIATRSSGSPRNSRATIAILR